MSKRIYPRSPSKTIYFPWDDAATIFEKTGSWTVEFYGSAALAMCAALMAIVIHKMPFPKKHAKPVEAVTPAAIGG